MTSLPHLTAAVFAAVFAVILLMLLRRDQIYVRQAFFWVMVTASVLLFGLAPGMLDAIGQKLGIAYPPIVIVLLGVLVLLVKALAADIALTRMERRLRRLAQRVAILDEPTCGDNERKD